MIWQFLKDLGSVIQGAMALKPEVFQAAYDLPHTGLLALAILVLAGLSLTIGQSVVLFINRVSPRNFLMSIAISVVYFVVGVFFWTFIIWLIGSLIFTDQKLSFRAVLLAVALAHAPYVLGFLIVLPYLGIFIRYLLQVWALLAVIVGLSVANIPPWRLFVAALLGWLIVEIIYRLIGRPIDAISRWLWYVQTGRRERYSIPELVDMMMNEELNSGI